jgi:hypothetical protein
MKHTRQPGIFLLVKVVLLLNIASGAFVLLILFGATLFDSFSSSFEKSEVTLDVRKSDIDTMRLTIDNSHEYGFMQSRTGDLKIMMPWYAPLFVPFGFWNVPGFELSVPYWLFYCSLCFLFYRILASTEIESPFSDKNIKRIFWIGYILILYDAFTVIRFIILSIFVQDVTDKTYHYDGLGPLVYFKVGILVIILAMIYRRGVSMQREQELTV